MARLADMLFLACDGDRSTSLAKRGLGLSSNDKWDIGPGAPLMLGILLGKRLHHEAFYQPRSCSSRFRTTGTVLNALQQRARVAPPRHSFHRHQPGVSTRDASNPRSRLMLNLLLASFVEFERS